MTVLIPAFNILYCFNLCRSITVCVSVWCGHKLHFLKSRILFTNYSSDLYDFTSDFLAPALVSHPIPQRAGSDLNKPTNHIPKVNKVWTRVLGGQPKR